MKRLSVFLTVLHLCVSLHAQKYHFTPIGLQDELPMTFLLDMANDQRGNLWVAVFGSGVGYYDGSTYHQIDADNGLGSNLITQLVEDKDGNIWFAERGTGISIYDGINFTHLGEENGLSYSSIFSMICDRNNHIWAGTNNNGVMRWDGHEFAPPPGSERMGTNIIHALYEDRKGQIWIGAEDGIYVFRNNTLIPFEVEGGPSKTPVTSFVEDHQGRLWVGTSQNGLYRFAGEEFVHLSTANGLPSNEIKALEEDGKGRVWFGGPEGAGYFQNGNLTLFNTSNGLCFDDVDLLHEDVEGNIWLGSGVKGLCRFSNDAFVMYDDGKEESDLLIWAITRSPNGNLWAGTSTGIFQLENNILVPEKSSAPFLGKSLVTYLQNDEEGYTWIGSPAGVFKYDGKNYEPQFPEHNFSYEYIYDIVKDATGTTWVSTSANVYKSVPGQELTVVKGFPENLHGTILNIQNHPDGTIYMASVDAGLISYKNDTAIALRDEFPLLDLSATCLSLADDGSIWVGSLTGLYKFDGNSTCYVDVHEDQKSTPVVSILRDQLNYFWIGTDRGLSRVLLSQQEDVKQMDRFSYEDGFMGIECNQNSLFSDREGNLWVGTLKGLVKCNTWDLGALPPPMSPQITGLRLFRESVNWATGGAKKMPWNSSPDAIELPWDQNHLTLDFHANQFSTPKKVRYSYLLEGMDDQWSPVSSEQSAVYTNLAPGKYTFKVRSHLGNAVSPAAPTELFITIQRPFWRTWWFYSLSVLALGLLIYSAIKYRVRRLHNYNERLQAEVEIRTKELKAEKEKVETASRKILRQRMEAEEANQAKSEFLATMSHEIRTPMNGVIGMTDLLMRTPLGEDQRKFVRNIRLSGESLLSLINDILDFSRIESGKMDLEERSFNLRELVEGVLQMLAYGAHDKDLDLIYDIDPAIPTEILGDPTRLRQIFINLIGNAIKFTHEGHIAIKIRVVGQKGDRIDLACEVEDTGIGIPEAKQAHLFEAFTQVEASTTRKYGGSGLGLTICHRLVQMMGGDIRVFSVSGKGATFSFNLPSIKTGNGTSPVHSEVKDMHLFVGSFKEVSEDILRKWCTHLDINLTSSRDPQAIANALRNPESFDHMILDARLTRKHADISDLILQQMRKKTVPITLIVRPESAVQEFQHRFADCQFMLRPLQYQGLLNNLLQKEDAGLRDPLLTPLEEVVLLANEFPLNILVAEDNPINQDVARGILKRLGYQPEIAENGVKVLEKLEQNEYDLIFMDVQMPEMDGLTATRRIVSEYAEKRPRIIAMTANAMEGDRENCIAAGMDGYISKPIQLNEVISALRNTPVVSRLHPQPQASQAKQANGKVVNLTELQKLAGGDTDFVVAILSKIIARLNPTLAKMQPLADAGELNELRQLAHSIKSSSGYAGSTELTGLLQEIEWGAESVLPKIELDKKIQQAKILGAQVVEELSTELMEVQA